MNQTGDERSPLGLFIKFFPVTEAVKERAEEIWRAIERYLPGALDSEIIPSAVIYVSMISIEPDLDLRTERRKLIETILFSNR